LTNQTTSLHSQPIFFEPTTLRADIEVLFSTYWGDMPGEEWPTHVTISCQSKIPQLATHWYPHTRGNQRKSKRKNHNDNGHDLPHVNANENQAPLDHETREEWELNEKPFFT